MILVIFTACTDFSINPRLHFWIFNHRRQHCVLCSSYRQISEIFIDLLQIPPNTFFPVIFTTTSVFPYKRCVRDIFFQDKNVQRNHFCHFHKACLFTFITHGESWKKCWIVIVRYRVWHFKIDQDLICWFWLSCRKVISLPGTQQMYCSFCKATLA